MAKGAKKKGFKKKSSSRKKSSSKAKSSEKHKHKFFSGKTLKITGIILAILLFVLAMLFLFGVQIKFLLYDELYMEMSPLEYSLDIVNGEQTNVTFDFDLAAPLTCNTRCTFELIDLSTNTSLLRKVVEEASKESFNIPLDMDALGEGQNLFSFQATCNNVRSTLCTSKEYPFFKTALITANYNLSESDSAKKNISQDRILVFTNNLIVMDEFLQESSLYLAELNYSLNSSSVEESSMLTRISDAQEDFTSLIESKDKLLSLWQNYQFTELLSELNSLEGNLNSLLDESEDIYGDSVSLFSSFDNSLSVLENIASFESKLKDAKILFTKHGDAVHLSELVSLEDSIEDISYRVAEKDFNTFGDINSDINSLSVRVNILLDDYAVLRDQLINDSIHYEKTLSDVIYYLDNGTFPVSVLVPTLTSKSAPPDLDSSCIALLETISNSSQHDVIAQTNKETIYPYLNHSVLLRSASDLFIDYVIEKQTNASAIFYLNPLTYNLAPTDYPALIGGLIVNTYNITLIPESDFQLISKINVSKITNGFESTYCVPVLVAFTLNVSVLPDLNDSISVSSSINVEFPELFSQCCYMGDCSACCDEPECAQENYPVLLVHGHSIDKDNSPEEAFDRLTKMQNELETIGYVNAGQISAISDFTTIPDGDWGRMNNPISVRVTYYYITHQDVAGLQFVTEKTDSIENYALRLRETITEVKRRTGKDKVILVAHSMGGLVCREYIYLFGGADIEKLVTLGTPNKGIEGDVKRFCTVTGAQKECEDMYFDSVFMSRLNAPGVVPQFTDVYTVTAHGCMMSSEDGRGEDGDGVVLARNVPLDFATNYDTNGTCTDFLGTNLHLRFVEPDLFPDTFDILAEILEN